MSPKPASIGSLNVIVLSVRPLKRGREPKASGARKSTREMVADDVTWAGREVCTNQKFPYAHAPLLGLPFEAPPRSAALATMPYAPDSRTYDRMSPSELNQKKVPPPPLGE